MADAKKLQVQFRGDCEIPSAIMFGDDRSCLQRGCRDAE